MFQDRALAGAPLCYSIDHAKRHIDDLEREILAFQDSGPYARVIEPNADGTADVHKVKLVRPMPDRLTGIVGDILNNLRSSLDHAGHATAIAAGGSGKSAGFPFGDTLDEVRNQARRSSKNIPKEIFEVMVALGPYKGGNDLLWAMNKLCNTYKHRMIIRPHIFAQYEGVDFRTQSSEVSLGQPEFFWPTWDAAKNETTICILPHGEACKYHLKLRISVTIYDPEIVGMQPAATFVRDLLGAVEDSLAVIEARAQGIGLFPTP